MSYEESREVLPIQCQFQKLINSLHRFKHNINKSAVALQIWENTNKKNEIKEETVELQRLIEIELNSLHNQTSKYCKSRILNSTQQTQRIAN